MIVVEGPDMAGKSTLVQRLFEAIPGQTGRAAMPRHFTKPPRSFDKYWGYKACVQRDVILDRFHLSHLAYRAVDGEPHDLTPLRYELIEADISRVGGFTVLLLPGRELIRERWDKVARTRAEMYSLEHVLQVNEVFEQARAGSLTIGSSTYALRGVTVVQGAWDEGTVSQIVDRWDARQRELYEICANKPWRL